MQIDGHISPYGCQPKGPLNGAPETGTHSSWAMDVPDSGMVNPKTGGSILRFVFRGLGASQRLGLCFAGRQQQGGSPLTCCSWLACNCPLPMMLACPWNHLLLAVTSKCLPVRNCSPVIGGRNACWLAIDNTRRLQSDQRSAWLMRALTAQNAHAVCARCVLRWLAIDGCCLGLATKY